MTRLLCQHPEESREPLPYDGASPADPDDWQCGECGGLGLRLDRRTYEQRQAAAREQERIDAEFEKFEERQRVRYSTKALRTMEGEVYVPVMLPPMDFRNETVANILDQIYKASGVAPVLTQMVDQVDVTTLFDTKKQAIDVIREKAIEGGFDPARPDYDLVATIVRIGAVAHHAFKRVDRVEFAHDLFRRSLGLTTGMYGAGSSMFAYGVNHERTMVGLPFESKNLPPFSFRVVGS